jgi:hypothetical protein
MSKEIEDPGVQELQESGVQELQKAPGNAQRVSDLPHLSHGKIFLAIAPLMLRPKVA